MSDTERFTAYQNALISHGVPVNLAAEAAKILDREKPGYQRTEEEQQIITSAHTWMFAKPEERNDEQSK